MRLWQLACLRCASVIDIYYLPPSSCLTQARFLSLCYFKSRCLAAYFDSLWLDWRSLSCHWLMNCVTWLNVCQWGAYRITRSGARYCRDKLSVCPNVCPSVMLVDCDHTHWNSSKIIFRSFAVAATTSWNSLPLAIRSSVSTFSFRCQLKTFFYNLAFRPS